MATQDENAGDEAQLEDEEELDEEEDEEESGAEDEESDEDEDAAEDDDAPLPKTRKELNALLRKTVGKAVADSIAAQRRRSSQGQGDRSGKDGKNGRRVLPARAPKQNEELEGVKKTVESLQLSETKRSFGYDHGLSPQQVDFVAKFDTRLSPKTLELPHIKAALESIATAAKARNNTPRTSGRTFTSKDKPFAALKDDDKRKNFTEHRRSLLEGKK
jgi:hypothetical protein